MSQSVRLDLTSLKSALASYVASAKIDLTSLSATTDNIVGLVDTIGKIYTIDTSVYDKLPELDGEYLSFGKTVEEWQQDMTLPVSYDNDSDGNKALKDYVPSYRPVSFSITLGRKIFPTSIPYGNIERAVHNEGQFIEIVAMITKKLEDSVSAWKYGAKRQLLGEVMSRIDNANSTSGSTAYTTNSTALEVGKVYRSGSPVKYAVAMVSQAAENKTFAELIAEGKLVELHMKQEVAIPEDTSTGEAFIKAVRNAVEKASDISEGFSFNGNVIGAEQGLVLYVKQGVEAVLDVDTMAGAFHLDKVALPVEMKVIKDFGAYSGKGYALLMDRRAVRLFEGYNATRNQENGYGDRLNIFRHLEFTGHISRNAFFVEFCDD